jgi:hypothetical protein
MSTPDTTDALEAIERILAEGGDADEALRRVVAALHERAGSAWAGIFFVEAGDLRLGPAAGEPDDSRRTQVDVRWRGDRVAELAVDGAAPGDRPFLEQVATRIAGHCLVGWDTGGEPWDD